MIPSAHSPRPRHAVNGESSWLGLRRPWLENALELVGFMLVAVAQVSNTILARGHPLHRSRGVPHDSI
jgi:hypothetical protein